MKRYIIIGALLASALVAHASTAKSPEQIAELAMKAVIYITVYDSSNQPVSQATGFVTQLNDRSYYVVTNAHVMKGAAAVKLTAQTGKDLEFTGYTGYDEEADIAILNMQWGDYRADSSWEPLYLANYRPVIGQHIYVAGHPEGLGFTFSDGMVSSLYPHTIQITAPVSHGSSGSPVMDENGMVVGVAVGIHPKGENLNFAKPADMIEPTNKAGMHCPKTADYRHYAQPKVAFEAPSAPDVDTTMPEAVADVVSSYLTATAHDQVVDLGKYCTLTLDRWYNLFSANWYQAQNHLAEDAKRWKSQSNDYHFNQGLWWNTAKDSGKAHQYLLMIPVTWTGVDWDNKKTVVNTYIYAIVEPDTTGKYRISSLWNDTKQILRPAK